MKIRHRSTGTDFLIALASTLIVAAICYPFARTIGHQTVGLIFLMTISVLSLFLGRAALIFTAILNFCVWNFFFIQPLYTFRVHSFHDLIALFTNLIVAIVGSALISRIRKSQVTLMSSQERLNILHNFLKSLNDAVSIKDVVKRSVEGIRENFNAEIVLYLKEKNTEGLSTRPFGNTSLHSTEIFRSATRAFEKSSVNNDEPVTSEDIFFYPLQEPRKQFGVIGIEFPDGNPPEEEKMILLLAFISLISSALDREISIDEAKEKEISTESEKLFQTVLNSVSHELKTPISIISAAVSNINDERTSSRPEIMRQIGEELEGASRRMNHLVENILDMSRIESGLLKLNLQISDISDIIGVAVHELRKGEHKVRVNIEDNLPFIRADISLLRQALVNILHNALIYTPEGSVVEINAEMDSSEMIKVSVNDEGPGIPGNYLPHLFDKFYRVPGTRTGGTGLGLTIAKAIAELHGGTVTANNRVKGGLSVNLFLKTGYGEQREI